MDSQMEEAAPFLEEKRHAEERNFGRNVDVELLPPPRRSLARRLAPLLVPAALVLALLLATVTRGHLGCLSRSPATGQSVADQVDSLTPEPAISTSGERDARPWKRAAQVSNSSAEVLECFQVAQPVLTPKGATTSDDYTSQAAAPHESSEPCTVVLMDHVFAYSYGIPFVSNYTPPSCDFNRVVLNFTVVSEGRQFDRLALMYFNDTEIWRTSTAEPVVPPGIRWVYLKDTTEFLSLWKTPQKLIFDLGNLITDVYTGSFNTTLTATFFTADVNTGGAAPSDLIIPISARKGSSDSGSHFTLPADNATNTISFPRNANRAVFSVSANGQADEEFWWSNVLQSDTEAFSDSIGDLLGYSPFREVQVFIDGQLAGVQWPFPVVFTGGVVPSLHRPIVGIDVFDLREHEIDITPWLPLLSDGEEHTFTINVAGLLDDGNTASLTETVGSSWYVSGKIFVWLDEDEDAITTGSAPVVVNTAPSISVSQHVLADSTGTNETLQYSVSVARTFSVQGVVKSRQSSGSVVWSQALSYSNQGYLWGFGYNQINNQTLQGHDKAVGPGGHYTYSTDYSYPTYCNTTVSYSPEGNLTLWANLQQGLDLQVTGSAVYPTGLEAFAYSGSGYPSFAHGGSLLSTRVNGTAFYFQTADGTSSTGYGSSTQDFQFGGLSAAGSLGQTPDVTLYSRDVSVVNQTITYDKEVIGGAQTAGDSGRGGGSGHGQSSNQYAQAPVNGGTGPRVFVGRGGANPEVSTSSSSSDSDVSVSQRANQAFMGSASEDD